MALHRREAGGRCGGGGAQYFPSFRAAFAMDGLIAVAFTAGEAEGYAKCEARFWKRCAAESAQRRGDDEKSQILAVGSTVELERGGEHGLTF